MEESEKGQENPQLADILFVLERLVKKTPVRHALWTQIVGVTQTRKMGILKVLELLLDRL
jgi:hypothetical protein